VAAGNVLCARCLTNTLVVPNMLFMRSTTNPAPTNPADDLVTYESDSATAPYQLADDGYVMCSMSPHRVRRAELAHGFIGPVCRRCACGGAS